MTLKLLTEQHLEFLSLNGGCTGLSESILVRNHMSPLICFVPCWLFVLKCSNCVCVFCPCFCDVVLCVLSSLAIISLMKGELIVELLCECLCSYVSSSWDMDWCAIYDCSISWSYSQYMYKLVWTQIAQL